MVKCPETGKEISTGIWCDGESFSWLPLVPSGMWLEFLRRDLQQFEAT